MFRKPKTRKLKDQASAAVSKGKYQKALDAYLELERLEPTGDWSRRVGEMYRQLEHPGDAVAAFSRAVDRYAEAGFLVKSIAVCRMILRLDPEHTDAQRRLVSLNAARGIHIETVSADETVEVQPGEAQAAAAEPPPMTQKGRTLPPGAAIEEISLHKSVPGSVEVPDLAVGEDSSSKVFEIPIELDDVDIIEADTGEDDTEDALERTPLFSELPPAVLHSIISKVRLVELAPGDVLFNQGDIGQELFVVADGEVAVVDEGPPRVHLTTLGEGAFFGEVAVVTSQARTATIEATQQSELLGVSRQVISDLIEQEPEVLKVLLRFLRERLVENLVRSNPLFSPFGEGERSSLASKFRFLEVQSGTVMVMQGHQSKGMYILLAGSAEVVRHDDGKTRRLATLGAGDLAGEMSLLANSEAIATVKTTAKTLALELRADIFREVIMTHPQVLMYVSEVADTRKRAFDQIAAGEADYQPSKLGLV